jgi:hypothetical protein
MTEGLMFLFNLFRPRPITLLNNLYPGTCTGYCNTRRVGRSETQKFDRKFRGEMVGKCYSFGVQIILVNSNSLVQINFTENL